MPKANPLIQSFNSGEFSPLMRGQVGLKYYPSACRRLRNFVPAVEGPARRRPGTYFAAEVKNSANRTWLARFEYNVEQAYVLEFGDQYIRFYSNHAQVLSGPPLEVSSPYLLADLTNADGTFALKFEQANDVLYIFHSKYRTRTLTRTGAAAFTLAEFEARGGPFEDVDPDETRTVYASAATGAGITLTASSAIFQSYHVGTLFYMEGKKVDDIKAWEQGKAVVAGVSPADLRKSDGKTYKALANGTTGTVKPVHIEGALYDGDAGVQWEYQDPGFGWVKITAIGGAPPATTATATVMSPRLPYGCVLVGQATTRWAFQSWNSNDGWPTVGSFWKQRLCAFRKRDFWASVAADFTDFRRKDESGDATPDMALDLEIAADQSNDIRWVAPTDTALLVGTAADEHVIFKQTDAEPLSGVNIEARKQTSHGASSVAPQRVGDDVVFVQRSGRKIRDIHYKFEKDGYVSGVVTRFSRHVARNKIIDMSYQQEPDSVLWAATGDGTLLGFTLNNDEDVKGCHPHFLGGSYGVLTRAVVESIACIPDPVSGYNELWMIVKRTINGTTRRYVEFMKQHYEEGDDEETAFYVDCGLSLDNVMNATLTPGAGATVKGTIGVPFTAGSAIFVAGDVGKKIQYRHQIDDPDSDTHELVYRTATATITQYNSTTSVNATINVPWPDLTALAANVWRKTVSSVSGLGHLEGQVVSVFSDAGPETNKTVTAGAVTLDVQAGKIHVGLPYKSVLQPMPIEAGAAEGTSQGRTKRAHRVLIRFDNTLGAKYGRDEDSQLDSVQMGTSIMNEASKFFTGDKVVPWPDGYSEDMLITIIQDQPCPCTVVALAPQMMTQG